MKGSFVFSFRLPQEFDRHAKQNKEHVRDEVIKILSDLKRKDQAQKWEALWEEDRKESLAFEKAWEEANIAHIGNQINDMEIDDE